MRTLMNVAKVVALLFGVSISYADDILIKKGEYLAKASDCIACHTSNSGQDFSGGAPFTTPFGTIYSTNITPDSATGIGDYSLEDFAGALRQGIAPKGNLYPAMPYTSYSILTDEDIAALYAYFMSLPAVKKENLENDVSFPFNVRAGIKAWNILADAPGVYQNIEGKSELWNRGNYLVNGPGHCGQCHTPRNDFMAMDYSQRFAGALIEGVEAPDITSNELNRQQWTHDDLREILTTGYSRKGTVFAGMYPVVYHSFSHLTDRDLFSVSTYLLDNENAIATKAAIFNGHDDSAAGFDIYKGYCAGCHGADGDAKPHLAPLIKGNGTVDRASAHNLIYVILQGVPTQTYSLTNAFYAMPGNAKHLNNQQVADLTNYVRATWSQQSANISAEDVQAVRDIIENVQGQ